MWAIQDWREGEIEKDSKVKHDVNAKLILTVEMIFTHIILLGPEL